MRIKWSGGSVREDRVGDDRVEPDRRVEQGPVTTPVVVDPAVESVVESVVEPAAGPGAARPLASEEVARIQVEPEDRLAFRVGVNILTLALVGLSIYLVWRRYFAGG